MSKDPSPSSAVEPAEGRRERTLAPSPAAEDSSSVAGVRGPSLEIEIVASCTKAGALSVRVNDSAGDFKLALVAAGFKAGDRALLTLVPEFCQFAGGEWTNGRLTGRHGRKCRCHEDGLIRELELDELPDHLLTPPSP